MKRFPFFAKLPKPTITAIRRQAKARKLKQWQVIQAAVGTIKVYPQSRAFWGMFTADEPPKERLKPSKRKARK